MANDNNELFHNKKDIWFYILTFLPPKDLLTINLVCKFLQSLVLDNQIWQPFLEPSLKTNTINNSSLKNLFFATQKTVTTFALETIDLIFHAQESNEGKVRAGPYRFIIPGIDWPQYIENFKAKKIPSILVTKKILEIISNDLKKYPQGINQLGFKENTLVHCLATIADQETTDYLIQIGANFAQQNSLKMSPRMLLQIYNSDLQLPKIIESEKTAAEEFRIGPS